MKQLKYYFVIALIFLMSCCHTNTLNSYKQEKNDNQYESIVVENNNENFENNIEKNNNINNIENEQQGIEQKTSYIGNKNTKKFHTLDCYNLPKLENQIEFESSEQAVKEDYSPCKNCNPQ